MKTKKELKQEYKQTKFPMGVFRIRNLINGKIFIGSSVNLDKIWNSHKFKLNNGLHPNKELQKDWNDYGENNFVYEILEEIKESAEPADYEKEVKDIEEICIEEYQPFGQKGYNIKLKKC